MSISYKIYTMTSKIIKNKKKVLTYVIDNRAYTDPLEHRKNLSGLPYPVLMIFE